MVEKANKRERELETENKQTERGNGMQRFLSKLTIRGATHFHPGVEQYSRVEDKRKMKHMADTR